MIHSKGFSRGRGRRSTKLGNPCDGKGEEDVRAGLRARLRTVPPMSEAEGRR